MRPAGRRARSRSRRRGGRRGHPVLGAPHVGGVLARAQQPAADLADRPVSGHLAARDRRHRLVEQLHALGDAPGRDMGLPEERDGLELEVGVPETPERSQAPRRRHCSRSSGRCGKRARVEDQPAVRGALLDPLEQALGPRHPSARDRRSSRGRSVHEREPARHVRGLDAPARPPVGGEGASSMSSIAASYSPSKFATSLSPSSASGVRSSSRASSKQARARSQSAAAIAS